MKMNSVYLLFALLCFPLCLAQETALKCADKTLFSSGYVLLNRTVDLTRAYNDVASCATLKTDSNVLCCYMKIKFENLDYDQKYTQKGCVEVKTSDYFDINDEDRFDAFLETMEKGINDKNDRLEVDSLDIDCSAKFINIFTLSLLLFLL